METVEAAGLSDTSLQVWYTVGRRILTTTVGPRLAQERIVATEFQGPIKNSTDVDRKIVFQRKTETLAQERKEVADIVLGVNTTLSTKKVPSYVRLQQLAFNKNSNLSRLLWVVTTRSMKL